MMMIFSVIIVFGGDVVKWDDFVIMVIDGVSVEVFKGMFVICVVE